MKYNISQLKAKINKVTRFYQGLLLEENKEQENNERDISYNTTKRINDKIQQQERSIEIENNNQDEKRDNIKKIIERMIDDRTGNAYSNTGDIHKNGNTTFSAMERTIHNSQDFLLNHVDSNFSRCNVC